MKEMVKKVLLLTAATICCTAVIVGGAWCSVRCNSSLCTHVNIIVEDSVKRQFVDSEELNGYLKIKGMHPQGDSMDLVDCHTIEQCLLKHNMVRTVECYKSPFGKINISVTQRTPTLGVVSNNGCYYVDSDRQIMPIRGEMSTQLPIFKGAVSERAAQEEYFDFVKWLTADSYWSKRITTIHVHNAKHLVLNQENLEAKIILGELIGYEEKLDKLRHLYTKGLDKIGYPEYHEYDLRFAGQIVGRK